MNKKNLILKPEYKPTGLNVNKPAKEIKKDIIKLIKTSCLKLGYNNKIKISNHDIKYMIDILYSILIDIQDIQDIKDIDFKKVITQNQKYKPSNIFILNSDTGYSCINRYNGRCVCCDVCYAAKFENLYNDTIIKHIRDTLYFYCIDPDIIIKDINYLNTRSRGKNLLALRLNENGDLNNDVQIKKINYIKSGLNKNIKVFYYSKSLNLVNDLNQDIIFNNSTNKDYKSYLFLSLKDYKQQFNLNKGGAFFYNIINNVCIGKCHLCGRCSSKYSTNTVIVEH